jgi:vacuolar protein sorting-associated protein 35
MDTAVSVELFVEILNRYVYYYEQENEAVSRSHPTSLLPISQKLIGDQVTTKYLNGLIELIHSNLATNDASASLDNPRKHFQRTLDYINACNFDGVITNPPLA